LDQTIHTLSYLHKLRKTRSHVFAVTDENVGWVLDAVGLFTTFPCTYSWHFAQGEHEIEVDHGILGQTCGLLPVGIESTILSTYGLEWNLSMCLIVTPFPGADLLVLQQTAYPPLTV